MDEQKPTLLITAILIEPPSSGGEVDWVDSDLSDRITAALDDATKELPQATPLHCYTYIQLNPEEDNCFVCEHCGCWTTDYTKPDEIHGLPLGRRFEGMLVCNQCECWKHDPHYGWARELALQKFLDQCDLGSEECLQRLADPVFRESLYKLLHPTADPRHLQLLRHMFALEHSYRRREEEQTADYYVFFENIYWCALLLYQIGDLEDVIPMWRAKNIDMDTSGGFDVQFMVGGGVSETLVYLQGLDVPEAEELSEYLQGHLNELTAQALDEWLEHKIQDYSEWCTSGHGNWWPGGPIK